MGGEEAGGRRWGWARGGGTGIHNSQQSQSGRDALSTPHKPSTIMKCHLKKILVCSSCLQTLDMTTANLQGAP